MGPLAGIKILEMGGIGPAPFCGMVLSDMGADVLRVDRIARADVGLVIDPRHDVLGRGRRTVAVDLKSEEGQRLIAELANSADMLIEGFRPGVMERLGLGPDALCEANPKLVYGRMTGWGQTGPIAASAGHDINYIALSGALHAIGPAGGAPVPPLNLVGDFGGGGMLLAMGMLAAFIEAQHSGRGQVVDAAMLDGAILLMAPILGLRNAGVWDDRRGTNLLDGGAPWYSTYETADGRYVAIGAIEAKFYVELIERMGLDATSLPEQHDKARWPELRTAFETAFRQRTRDEWCTVLEGSDACFAPVLSMDEAHAHPQARERDGFVEVDGFRQAAAAPRFSRTPSQIRHGARAPGTHTLEGLAAWGVAETRIEALKTAGIIHQSH